MIIPLCFESLAQSSTLLVLSKSANGPIFNASLSLPLYSNNDCDQTQSFIPDGSRLVSESFSLNVNSNGVGTFAGFARIVAPDGRVILQGNLRGTVGINTRCGTDKDCRLPGHMVGLFEGFPSLSARSISRSITELKSQVLMINFSADLNRESASPLPIYRTRLDGLVTVPSPVADSIKIAPGKSGYTPTEIITAIIFNGSDKTIRAYDQQSYCTFVQLQIQEGNRWTDVSVCPLNRLPDPTDILPNQKIEIALKPTMQTPGPNPPGVYRLGLTFKVVENGNPVGESLFVASDPFRIAAPPSVEKVSITTERSSYDVSEPIVVKISNGNDQNIVTWDHKTHCTIVYVQKQEANGWANVAPCPLMTPTRLVTIGPNRDVLMKMPPENFNARFDPGTYRLEFAWFFVDGNGQPVGNPMTIYSPQFTLTSKQ
jgi:hypothetical protein